MSVLAYRLLLELRGRCELRKANHVENNVLVSRRAINAKELIEIKLDFLRAKFPGLI